MKTTTTLPTSLITFNVLLLDTTDEAMALTPCENLTCTGFIIDGDCTNNCNLDMDGGL
jgi:hypothetical protein